MSTTKKYRVIGTRPIRHDGVDKVTGRARYGADLQLPGMLHGAILRSPHGHAVIRSIDLAPALELPGVKAAMTSADFPPLASRIVHLAEGDITLEDLRDNVLADKKALYSGHAIAAVVATTAEAAREAIEKIRVDYEILPPLLDVRKAMDETKNLLHPDLLTDELGEKSAEPSNIAKHLVFETGDVVAGFKEADRIFEGDFKTTMVHQGYIEPQNGSAHWSEDGSLTVWTSTQGAFGVRQQLSEILDVPISRIKVVPMEIGGGFGGKIPVYLEPIAAVLSKKSGRPVRMSMSREEVFEGTGPTPGSSIRVKIGARKDGRIVAAEADMAYESGAYPGSPFACGMMTIFAPYDIENIKISGYDVCVNKPKTAPYRAPGATSAAFAGETILDQIAEWCGKDPLEVRLENTAKEGTRRADGLVYPRIGAIETVEAARSSEHYGSPLEGPWRGRGVASGYWFNAGMKSSCTVSVNPDGTVSLIEGSTDIGGTRTSLAMQLAEVLGIDTEDVNPQVVDTDTVGFNDITAGSRVTYASGLAVIDAAKDVQKKMAGRAALIWDVPVDKVTVEGARYFVEGDKDKSIDFKSLAAEIQSTGGPVVGEGSVDATSGVGGGFGTHIVDLEVDPDTGKVTILRYTAVQDVGKAIHPAYVEGQLQGGAAQGIGWALNEEYFYREDGTLANSSFLDYRMPTSLDLPMIDTIIVEVPNPGHPFGVRGVGEVPIVPPPAAIANALYQAIGVRLDTLPMNPGRVLKAILSKNAR